MLLSCHLGIACKDFSLRGARTKDIFKIPRNVGGLGDTGILRECSLSGHVHPSFVLWTGEKNTELPSSTAALTEWESE